MAVNIEKVKSEISNVVPFSGKYIDPPEGEYVTYLGPGQLKVPEKVVIGYIEGDGIGPEVAYAAIKVANAAVEKAYGGSRKVIWYEVVVGEKGEKIFGTRLPSQSVDVLKKVRVFLKAPLETPVGGGFRSINVTLRQLFDLYANIRPVKYFPGLPSPLKKPEVDLVIFRENTEDVYAGIEWPYDSPEAAKVREFLRREFGINLRDDAGIGIKPISKFGTQRIARLALKFAVENKRRVVTVMHKGNIQKYTEGAFKEWAFEVARTEFRQHVVFEEELGQYGGQVPPGKILVNDRIADNMLQQLLTRTGEYDVILAPNLNGDYVSDEAAGLVGGLGVAPGIDVGDWGMMAEPVHGTAPKYRGKNYVNPTATILAVELLFRFMGWIEAASYISKGVEATYRSGYYTADLVRQMDEEEKRRVKEVLGTQEFADKVVELIKAL
ncbi:NADP-dependent isocitrate dehydrogenase [Pyrobaculum neutrophilum]|uniref:isocitrate dehydrogenase (NADP(+)) n=1 Tax=Pyrobaculum neutrophilum (strain DSM 2338 / JCM 9278 / NBRC 100436 / V24Sta) TaxID=444157 RepID=B1YCX4_PYRNV|nr:NADP-dependent isocitrate dehydrogenase [Pyrobaculum neutrophilum]ACB39637.1 isocitrate dehydrogenase, NADP-dependent [Pyrobaculum neutrophilum V24Sta]